MMDDDEPVIVTYNQLENEQQDISKYISQAFGPQGQGYLLVSNIPDGFVELRRELLPLIQKMAQLGDTVLEKYMAPESLELFNSRGWSKVSIPHPQGITQKCSFYFTCPDIRTQTMQQICSIRKDNHHDPFKNPAGQKALKLFTEKNIWIEEIQQIRLKQDQKSNFKFKALTMANIMRHVGQLLAKRIDAYMKELQVPNYPPNQLQDIVNKGTTHMGRLIYYYPTDIINDQEKDWCHRHTDYCALTALTSAQYLDKDGNAIQIAPAAGGLYMVSRDNRPQQVKTREDMLSFHIGESLRILSGGHLTSTPHSVGTSESIKGRGIGRATVALFMQPNPYHVMKVPEGEDPLQIEKPSNSEVRGLKGRWKNGMLFGHFLHNCYNRSSYS